MMMKMSDFKYTYKQLYDNKSQCERCHHDTCQDKGKRSMYDGSKHTCSRFKVHTKERRAEIEREGCDKAFEDYWKNFTLGPIVVTYSSDERTSTQVSMDELYDFIKTVAPMSDRR